MKCTLSIPWCSYIEFDDKGSSDGSFLPEACHRMCNLGYPSTYRCINSSCHYRYNEGWPHPFVALQHVTSLFFLQCIVLHALLIKEGMHNANMANIPARNNVKYPECFSWMANLR